MTEKDLQLQAKQEFQTPSESTRNVPIFIPAVDIYESENGMVLLADMPGVSSDGVEIDLKDGQLTIRGTARTEGSSGRTLFKEYTVGDYYRQFTVSHLIDHARIEASIKDGVLKVVLPKAEAAKPRKIAIKAG